MTEIVATPSVEIERLASRARRLHEAELVDPTVDHAALLEAVAAAIEVRTGDLLPPAEEETGLAEARLRGEIARTTGQLRAFATAVRKGESHDPIIDLADPEATPPRPDQRRANLPLGPVAVFAASNFPFAFGVAGGDTASAWAAGCPALVKAHPGHPRLSRALAAAVEAGLAESGADPAWFALVEGADEATGAALATVAEVAAIAFTGSFGGGTAIARLAASRPEPIPVYAEMGAVNPVLVTPAAAAARGESIGAGLAAAVTAHAGQLCTKPGVVMLVDDEAGRALAAALAAGITAAPPHRMLYPALAESFARGLAVAADDPRVSAVVDGAPRAGEDGDGRLGALLELRAADLRPDDPRLKELFGPAALIVWAGDGEELLAAAGHLEGSLAAAVHAEPGEELGGRLLRSLRGRVGRMIWNEFPTGVTVGHATVHGGPFPATTAPTTTSVGMTAMRRFLRPVGYQGVPDELLPPALRDANPLGLLRQVDGEWTRDAVNV
ncbi:MAG: aldehyde dehydrogenase family protein [Actinobacteria bacterium]|nr:aldehyde dehydrogenase family protein [Actinomycetota bacterium]